MGYYVFDPSTPIPLFFWESCPLLLEHLVLQSVILNIENCTEEVVNTTSFKPLHIIL